MWTIAQYPLILLEQLLMNSKIDILSVILKELREMLKDAPSCNVCNDKSNKYKIGETLIFYDYDSHHKNVWISSDCIDFLLKMYAAKALDFQIIESNSSLSESHSQSQISQLSKTFVIPKETPTKDKWIKDDEAKVCMCCRKSKFSLLNRRHHCRRCGRVVCSDCSINKILLPELYKTLLVRCCDECFSQLLENEKRKFDSNSIEKGSDLLQEWKLTGDVLNDQLIRDEFFFDHSPNVNLFMAIIFLHTENTDLTKFILFHCHRVELLLKPIHGHMNPEVDVVLVSKMLKCLATTARIFGSTGESSIIDHADMILKIAENNCDTIISKVSSNPVFNVISIRDIINELIKTENWRLALELSVKWDRFSTSGVFSAWAVSLIKCGHYNLAREKMALALQPISGSSQRNNEEIILGISGNEEINPSQYKLKRPLKSSPLLYEILEILDFYAPKTSNNNISKSVTLKEGVKNSKVDNIKKLVDGDYGEIKRKLSNRLERNQNELLESVYYKESLFYLLSYAANCDILQFFVKNNLIRHAIRYSIVQNISHESFTTFVFIPVIRLGRLKDFMHLIKQNHINCWKNYVIAICKYLERKKSWHVLYQIQLLTDDFIRASLTSIKFYLKNSGNYTELYEKSRHLLDAKNHLQTELDRLERGNCENDNEIQLKWDVKAINAKISLILLQIEVSKFLANCEAEGIPILDIMPKIFMDKISLKTLLGKTHEITQVAILLIVCAPSICGAFGLCYRFVNTHYFEYDFNDFF